MNRCKTEKILQIKPRVRHCHSGAQNSFTNSDMGNESSNLRYLNIAGGLLQQHCFVPVFEGFVMFWCEFPEELVCVTTVISILNS